MAEPSCYTSCLSSRSVFPILRVMTVLMGLFFAACATDTQPAMPPRIVVHTEDLDSAGVFLTYYANRRTVSSKDWRLNLATNGSSLDSGEDVTIAFRLSYQGTLPKKTVSLPNPIKAVFHIAPATDPTVSRVAEMKLPFRKAPSRRDNPIGEAIADPGEGGSVAWEAVARDVFSSDTRKRGATPFAEGSYRLDVELVLDKDNHFAVTAIPLEIEKRHR
jgi:hypothetical protein